MSSYYNLDPKILLKENLEEIFNNEIKKARLNRTTLSLITIDFSRTHGEEALKKAAKTLQCKIRCTDIIGRTKIKELTVIVPNVDRKRAMLLVNRLRQSMDSFKKDESDKINIGFSSFPEDGISKKELIDKATYSLYKNKLW
ncbi:MAG: diguanylate cyclase [bacterium]|nr:diguanylate cyclase [bacterium]